MKITIKKIIILSFIAFVISSFNNVFATNYAGNYYENKKVSGNSNALESNDSDDSNLSLNGYRITSYDVEMNVDNYGIMDINETITIYANTSKHGIIRSIPIKNTVQRSDKTQYTNHARITNINVNDDYTISKEDENLKIKIGDADKTFVGEKVYKISYKYNTGSDRTRDYDELYYNIIGTEWDTYISNVSFKITMPKDFDSSKLGFTHGSYGLINTDGIEFSVNNNTITGTYSGTLYPNNGLTVRCELPEGYFEEQKINITYTDIAIIATSIIASLIAFILWIKYGRDKKAIKTVEFYPPKGLTSLDVGYFYYGKVDNKQIISLLIELADKGYIKIEENKDKKGLFDTNDYKIYPMKNYDGTMLNANEKDFKEGENKELSKEELLFYKGLISCMPSNKNYITNNNLKNNFYIYAQDIKNTENKKRKLIFKGNPKIQFIVFPIIILILFLPYFVFKRKFSIDSDLIYFCSFIGIWLGGFLSIMKVKESWLCNIMGIIIVLIYTVIGMSNMIDILEIIEIVLLVGSIIANIVFCNLITNRTDYGVEMLGKIGGFRDFLLTAEKDKLDALVNENPQYFYKILPYTYALNVSSEWIKKFEDITMEPPSWYYCDDRSTFNTRIFINSIYRDFNSMEQSMFSSPNNGSSGSGFSGGGFSGGGSGGGGGSSW